MRTILEDQSRWTAHVEGAVTGLAYATSLVALCVCAVGSFRPGELPKPYWPHVRALRTDTFGAVCFGVATLSLGASEYLRLLRRRDEAAPVARPGPAAPASPGVLAVARAVTAAASVLVVYLSVNTITHPVTLTTQATHLVGWPSEGTLRVVALAVAAVAAATVRVQQIAPRARLRDRS